MNNHDVEIVDFGFPEKKSDYLSKYAEELTAARYITNPAIAREDEIKKLIVILLTPDKSALLIGKPGIGKTAIVEGLAYKIQNNDVPNVLKNYRIYEISSSILSNKMMIDGKEELIVNQIVNELKEQTKIILFTVLTATTSTLHTHSENVCDMMQEPLETRELGYHGVLSGPWFKHNCGK